MAPPAISADADAMAMRDTVLPNTASPYCKYDRVPSLFEIPTANWPDRLAAGAGIWLSLIKQMKFHK
jgi:hypothetical protein